MFGCILRGTLGVQWYYREFRGEGVFMLRDRIDIQVAVFVLVFVLPTTRV